MLELDLFIDLKVKLHPEFKEAWVADLRSGEYAQTTGYLCLTKQDRERPAGYCCLGVACERLANDGLIDRKVNDVLGITSFDGVENVPTRNTYPMMFARPEGMALSTFNGQVCSIFSALADSNDSGSTFGQIAEWIEEHL